MIGLRTVALQLLAPAALAAVSPNPPATTGARPERIVLVTIDGARAGIDDWPAVMPALGALAREGRRFRFATTPTPLTFPATVAILAGREPATTGVRDEAAGAYKLDVPGLAATLGTAGFTTLALPGDRTANVKGPLAAGFETFEALSASFPDSVRVDSALAHLNRDGKRFVWIGFSFGQPLEPWRRWRGGGFRDSAAYAARAAAVDRVLARLAAGIARTHDTRATLVAVTGTHGEAVPDWPLSGSGFGETPVPGHGADLSEDVLCVPLILWGRGLGSVRARAGDPWVSTLDLAPTLAAAAGTRMISDGVSLWPLIEGRTLSPRVLVHETDAHRTLGAGPLIAAREGRVKRLACGRERVERTASAGARVPAGSSTSARLERVIAARLLKLTARKGTEAIAASPGATACEVTAKAWTELLAALPERGVLPDSVAIARLRSLRERWPDAPLVALEEAAARSLSGEDDPAARAFLDLRARHPDLEEAAIAYAEHLRRHRHGELVAGALATLPGASPLAADAVWRHAITSAHRLDVDAALAAYREAMALGAPPDPAWVESYPAFLRVVDAKRGVDAAPDSVRRRMAYGRALGEFGIYDECYSQLHQARFLDMGNPEPNYWMGVFLMAQRRPEQALNALDRVLELDANHVPALLASAEALALLNRNGEALAHQRKAVERDGRDPRARYNLACLLARTGDTEGAAAELERAVQAGYDDWRQMASDPDLESVRSTVIYQRLRQRASGRP